MNLNRLFYPKNVCFIGSSKLKESENMISPEIFKRVFYNIKNFFRNESKIIDLEKTKNLPKADLYILSLPEQKTLELIEDFDCKFCIILPGNYKRKRRLMRKMSEKQIRFLGPNSVCGLLNTSNGLNTSFENQMPKKGDISFITQSGGVGATLMDISMSNFVGVSKLAWLGYGWDIGFPELIEYLSNDASTKSIGIYIEGIRKGSDFIKAVKKCQKPIVALKGGITEQSSKRAMSHTSSLSGSSIIYSSVFKQTGIIEAQTMKQLYQTTHILSKGKTMKNNRIAIVSNVGGPCILASDYCLENGLELPNFSKKTIEKINEKYPKMDVINPLDLVADADSKRYSFCLKQVLDDKNIDGVLVINMLKSCTLQPEHTKPIARIIKNSKKPIIDCTPGKEDWEKIRKVMENQGVYVFDDLKESVEVLRNLIRWGK